MFKKEKLRSEFSYQRIRREIMTWNQNTFTKSDVSKVNRAKSPLFFPLESLETRLHKFSNGLVNSRTASNISKLDSSLDPRSFRESSFKYWASRDCQLTFERYCSRRGEQKSCLQQGGHHGNPDTAQLQVLTQHYGETVWGQFVHLCMREWGEVKQASKAVHWKVNVVAHVINAGFPLSTLAHRIDHRPALDWFQLDQRLPLQ